MNAFIVRLEILSLLLVISVVFLMSQQFPATLPQPAAKAKLHALPLKPSPTFFAHVHVPVGVSPECQQAVSGCGISH